MPYQDFRQFLDVLRQHGELIDVDRPVALSDVGKAMKQSYRRQGPGMVFKQNGTEFPLVAGVYSTRSKALLAFEADEKTILQKVLAGLDHPIAPNISTAAAPCHEVQIEGAAIDITRFPVPSTAPRTAGPTSLPASWSPRIRKPASRTSAITGSWCWAATPSRSRRSPCTGSARISPSASAWASSRGRPW